MSLAGFTKAALVAAFLCLTGCASVFVDRIQDESFPPVPLDPVAPTGKYFVEFNLLASLDEVRKKCGFRKGKACAFPFMDPCEVYMHVKDFAPYLLHEGYHCIKGYWHAKQESLY